MREYRKSGYFDLLVILLLGGIALSCAWIYREFAQDDAFIIYRYAKNLANGRGFVYNNGEHVLGTSTPLYALALAFLTKLSGQDVRLVSHALSIFSLWIGSTTLYLLGKESGRLIAAAVAMVFTTNGLLISAVGMETFFLLALLLLTLRCYLNEKLFLSGILLGMLLLTRYETILMAAVLGIHFLLRRRRFPTWLFAAAAVFLPWAIYAQQSFGSLIPQSAQAKLAARGAGQGISFAVGAAVWWRIYGNETAWHYAFIPLILLGAYSAFRSKCRNQGYVLILAWSAAYCFAASLSALSFPWYYGPLIPGFAILVIWGIEFLAKFVATLARHSLSFRPWAQRFQAGVLVLLALGIVALQLSSWTTGWVSHGGQIIDSRYTGYKEIAEWLNKHAEPDESLLTSEIGVLGYYADLKIRDLHGLVTPKVMPSLIHGYAETLTSSLEIYGPDYVLTGSLELVDSLEQDTDYRVIQAFSTDGTYYLLKRVLEHAPL